MLEVDGSRTTHRLGYAVEDEMAVPQAVVPAGRWFAAQRIAGTHGYTLVGCTVVPGFEFSEFELTESRTLLESHPAHGDLIQRLAPRKP